MQYFLVLGHPKKANPAYSKKILLRGVCGMCVQREKKIMQSFQNHSYSVYVVGALTFLKV